MRTTRFSALPYWFGPRLMDMDGSAPSVGGVRERAQQHRDVQVLLGVGHQEREADLGEEAGLAGAGEVAGGVEDEPVGAGTDPVGSQRSDPPVLVGRGSGEDGGLGADHLLEPDQESGGRLTPQGVQHVGADQAHAPTTRPRRSSAILRSSSTTTPASVASSLASRLRSEARTSSPERPVAQMRKTRSKRSS